MLRSIFNVSFLGLLVQLLGFSKLLLIANFYGASNELDAYYLALILPTLLLGFVGGGLQSSFMPVYGNLLSAGDKGRALQLLAQASVWLFLILLFLAAVIAYWSPSFIGLSSFSGDPSVEMKVLASGALQVLVFSFLINALIDFWGLAFHAAQRFVAVALAPVVNILVSSLPIVLVDNPGLAELVWGLIAGLLAQLLVLWWVASFSGKASKRIALFPLRELQRNGRIQLFSSDLSKVWYLCFPALLGVAVTNTNFAIDQVMAAGAGEGALSILNYASRFHNVIVQAGIMAVSVVLLPRFIELLAQRNYSQLFLTLRRMLLAALLLGGLAFIVVALAGRWSLAVVLDFTALSADNIDDIFSVWLWYSAGLFATAMCVFYVKLFQAWQMPGFITGLALVSLLLNVFLNWLLIPIFGVLGIAVATSLVYLFALLVYMLVAARLKRRHA